MGIGTSPLLRERKFSTSVVPNKYDWYLAVILGMLGLGGLASLHTAIEVYQGLAAGSLVSTVILFDMLFRNPPIEPSAKNLSSIILVGGGWAIAVGLYF